MAHGYIINLKGRTFKSNKLELSTIRDYQVDGLKKHTTTDVKVVNGFPNMVKKNKH